MKKEKKILFLIVLICSIAITVIISMKLLDTTGTINQGNFRMNDIVVNSYADIKEAESEELPQNFSDLSFELSQKNKITMMIAKNIDAKRIYIDHIRYTDPLKKGNFVISQTDVEENHFIDDNLESVEIYPIEKESQYYIELNLDNIEFMKEVKSPENTKKVTFDGTFFKTLDLKKEDLAFHFDCDLNIIDTAGKKSTCKLKFSLPSEELLQNGISILRQDVSKYVFVLK